MTAIAELTLDLVGASEGVSVRLFAPERSEKHWACRFEIGPPFAYGREIYGESSLQALALALKGLSATLYGSAEYRAGKLGVYGEFKGYLGVPAPNVFLGEAPYPF
jgi:hypothetical protein